MEVEIVKFDNNGRGIAYLDDKIVFVPKRVPGDILNIEITLDKKNYMEGKIINIVKPSKSRSNPICPYFNNCGGCDLLNISLSNMLDYKLDKVNNIFKSNKIDYIVKDIIKSSSQYNYRNKVSLKIVDNNIGYYEEDTHNIININYCYLCNEEINKIIKNLKKFDIHNGLVTIRVNYKDELLIIIDTKDELDNIDYFIDTYKVAGIILNNKTIYGDNYFIDMINDYLFKVSYNSFFQVNPYICSELFSLVFEYTKNSNNVLDLYSGVGTLSIVASSNASKVLGVEIVDNAVSDANINKVINKRNNVEFICSDTKKVIDRITSGFDTIILDPPRSGVDKNVINKIIEEKINKIVYVSCNPITLARDINLLKDYYEIYNIKVLDMFPNTEHVESFCVLLKK